MTWNYSGGTVEWNNRYLVDKDGKNTLELTLKGGTSRGEIPVDDYFIVGIRQHTDNFLRGHNEVSDTGHFGNAPDGHQLHAREYNLRASHPADAVLQRSQRPLYRFEMARFRGWCTNIRPRRTSSRKGKSSSTSAADSNWTCRREYFNLTYGRSLRDGTGTFAAYMGKRW